MTTLFVGYLALRLFGCLVLYVKTEDKLYSVQFRVLKMQARVFVSVFQIWRLSFEC